MAKRGKLTPSEIQTWRQVFGDVFKKLAPRVGEDEAKEIASKMAWASLEIPAWANDSTPSPMDGTGMKPRRSTESGEAKSKIISALATHHRYNAGSCLTSTPIGVNALAKLADVGSATVSTFFNVQFNEGKKGGHAKYQIACHDRGRLVDYLRVLQNDYPPCELFKSISAEQLRQIKAADD